MEQTPIGQIDHGLGKVECPRCGKFNYKGALLCGWGKCTGSLPHPSIKTSKTGQVGGIDMDKLSPTDVEEMVAAGDGFRVKKAGFDKYMEEIGSMIKSERDPVEARRLEGIRNNQVIHWYNKYHGTNFKS